MRTGCNSGYQAIHYALQHDARRIVLLGFDMHVSADGRRHHHAPHPVQSGTRYVQWAEYFEALVEPAADLGCEIVNCTPGSAVVAFPAVDLGAVL